MAVISLAQTLELTCLIFSSSLQLIRTLWVEWYLRSYQLVVSYRCMFFVFATFLTKAPDIGDTTAFTLSWFMKEIHHQDNKHLDAVRRMRTEAEELGNPNAFLGYGDASVSRRVKASEL